MKGQEKEEQSYHCVPHKTTGILRAAPPPSPPLWMRGALGGLGSLPGSLVDTWHTACSGSLPPDRGAIQHSDLLTALDCKIINLNTPF